MSLKRSLNYFAFCCGITKKVMLSAFFILSSVLIVRGQDIFMDDTLEIKTVTITASRSVRETPFSIVQIDSGSIERYQSDNLGLLLQSASPLSVKQVGNSGLSSVSMRGLSGSHTSVLWNGLPIVAPNTDQFDFMLLPVMPSFSVRMTEGGADLSDISGSIGGKIEIVSEPSKLKGTDALLSLSCGSFRDFSENLSVRTHLKNLSGNLSIWNRSSENKFLFINRNSPGGTTEERRNNSAYETRGLMNDLFYQKGRYVTSIHFWYSTSFRQLPGPVTTVQQNFGETQDDRSFRTVLHFKSETERFSSEITTGYSADINLYNNESAHVLGDNRSEMVTAKSDFRYKIAENLSLILNLGDEYQKAVSLSYPETENRNLISSSIAAEGKLFSRLKYMAQAREIISGKDLMAPEFTAGGSFMLSRNGKNILKANVSRNIKLPSLNDLFWNPGGNTALLPETSTGYEAGYSYSNTFNSGIYSLFSLSLHSSDIKNLIQWAPGEYSYWSASNIRSVKVNGAELKVSSSIPYQRGKTTFDAGYSFTRSIISSSALNNDNAIGKQLIYTPVHHANAGLHGTFDIFSGGVDMVIYGKRYITSDNSEWLSASCLLNGTFGILVPFNGSSLKIELKVNNLLNSQWESVRNYPMPLRSFMIKAKLDLFVHDKIKK